MTLPEPDGRTVLFMGGADSIDKKSRILGVDWFKEELITQKDLDSITVPDNTKIDIVISHTCPMEFHPLGDRKSYYNNDPSRYALSYILETYKPKLWYFGHWHCNSEGMYNDCKWYGLTLAGFTGWWRWIDDYGRR